MTTKYAWELIRFSDGRVIDSGEIEADTIEEAEYKANEESFAVHWNTPNEWHLEVPEVAKVEDSNNSGVWLYIRYQCDKDQTYVLTPFNTLYIEEKNASLRPSFALALVNLEKFERIPDSRDASVCKWRKRRE